MPTDIMPTDDFQRRRVVLRAGYFLCPVDRGLDRFDLIVAELEGLDLRRGRAARLLPRRAAKWSCTNLMISALVWFDATSIKWSAFPASRTPAMARKLRKQQLDTIPRLLIDGRDREGLRGSGPYG